MVMMLNSYYKMFDDSMSKYQVYKVNCVNDSHMIVSGEHMSFYTVLFLVNTGRLLVKTDNVIT